MTIEATVNDLVASVSALTNSVATKRAVLDTAASNADTSAVTAVNSANAAAASAAAAAAKATEATNNATQIAAYKTAAAALDTTTTATAAVAAQAADAMARFDPARHPFRNKLPSLVLDFGRQSAHKYSPLTGLVRQAITDVVTFTRNSTATYTGPDGLLKTAAINEPRYDYDPQTGECKGILIEEQRTNLLRFTGYLYDSAWVKHNVTLTPQCGLAPDGTMTAWLVKNTPGIVSSVSQLPIVTDGTYTRSLYVKPDGSGNSVIAFEGIGGPSGGGEALIFNAVTKTFSGYTSTPVSYSYQDVGNGWMRICIVTVKSATKILNHNYYIGAYGATAVQHGIYIWGPQLEAGAFPTSYIPSTDTFTSRASTATYLDSNGVLRTAAINTARSAAYDYDSDGVLRPIGLLLETSATNQLLYSEQFDNAAWVKYAGGTATAPVVTANYGVAPDGQTAADRVVMALNASTTLTDTSGISQTQTTVADTTYTQSVWLKTTDASTKVLQLSFNGENTKLITVTGTWQRFSNTGVASGTNRGFRLCLRGTTGTSDSADVLIWGAQQGVGSYPTSYIPTTSAQVTRAADVSTSAQSTRATDDVTVIGANFSSAYRQDAGTVVATSQTWFTPSTYPRILSINKNNANDESINLYHNAGSSGAIGLNVRTAAVTGMDMLVGSFSVNMKMKSAARIKVNDSAITVNGITPSVDSTVSLPQPNQMRIGGTALNNNQYSGTISRITYYPQAFSNEELQAITTL